MTMQRIAGLLLAGPLAATTAFGALPPAGPVACRVELDRAVLPAGTPQRAVVKVTLDAPAPPRRESRPPVNLSIVLDRSGPMHGEKLAKARDAAIEALRRLGPQDLFSVVIYNHRVETLVPAQSAANTEWIESRIREITSDGNTALFGGVSQGAAEVRKNLEPRYVHRIILLSDGLANVGPSSPADLGRLGAALAKENITVTTVGVGTDYNEDLMTQLAQAGDGNTYFVAETGDLPRIFAAELGDVLSVVARRVVLEIDFPEGARPLRVIGRDGRIRDRTVELNLAQLYGGQAKYALVEVELPPGAENEARDVAFARCVYEDVLGARAARSEGRVQARYSAAARDVAASVNARVNADLIRNEIALAQDAAVELADLNKPAEAAAVLQQQKEELRQRSAKLGIDAEVQKDLDELDRQGSRLEAEGMSKGLRKALRTDSYQTRNQQAAQ
jgi:Ca-activated chloride channel family protein